MTTQNLYYFIEITKDMHLPSTAARLFVSQQSLSGHIRRLENHFGVVLFERKHNLVLTPEGEVLLREAKLILDAEQRLLEQFRHNDQLQTIRLACHTARTQSYLPDALLNMSLTYPSVEVNCFDAEQVDIDRMFVNQELDIAIGSMPEDFPGRKSIKLGSTPGRILIAESLLKKHLGADTEAFILRAHNGLDVADIPTQVPIVQSSIANGISWVCKYVPELRQRPLAGRVSTNSRIQMQLHLEACRKGIAMLFVSEMYLRYLKQSLSSDQLDHILIFPHLYHGEVLMRDEYLTYNANLEHIPSFRFFIQCLKESFARMTESDR